MNKEAVPNLQPLEMGGGKRGSDVRERARPYASLWGGVVSLYVLLMFSFASVSFLGGSSCPHFLRSYLCVCVFALARVWCVFAACIIVVS